MILYYDLLRQIKKLKAADLKKLAYRLEQIDKRPNTYMATYLGEALHCCDFHFTGNNKLKDPCDCTCYCKNCEFIPTNRLGIRMQEIANSIENDDTIPNLLKEPVNMKLIKEIDGKPR